MKYIKSAAIGISIIGAFLLYMGLKVNHHNIELLILGCIVLIIGLIPFVLITKKEEINTNKVFEDWKNELVSNGLKIIVDLTKVKIKSNSYRQEIQRIEWKYEGLDELAGIDRRKFADINECIIEYKTDLKGKSEIFTSGNIAKDKITVQFLLMNKKTTELYIDKSNHENYYFNLDFLQ